MDKLIKAMCYYDSSLDFEVDWRVPNLIDETIKLTKLFPNLTYKTVSDVCFQDYVVFSEETITASEEELRTWIEKQNEMMEQLHEVFKKISPEQRKDYCDELSICPEKTLHVFEAEIKKERLFTEVTISLQDETLHTRFYTYDFIYKLGYWSTLTQEEFLDD